MEAVVHEGPRQVGVEDVLDARIDRPAGGVRGGGRVRAGRPPAEPVIGVPQEDGPVPAVGRAGASGPLVVGVLADPGTPGRLARWLAEELPGVLDDRPGCDEGWDVRVEVQRLPSPSPGHRRLLDAVRPWMREWEWDIAVCLTDFPLRDGESPLAADLIGADGVVVVSVPAFGGLLLRRRVRGVVADLITAAGPGAAPEDGTGRGATAPARPFRRVVPDGDPAEGPVDLRILAPPGRLRLLTGMVRDNRPWQLMSSLTGAMAAALATGAYTLITPSIWQLGDLLGPAKLLIAMVFAVAAMVTWLILTHHLWDRPSEATAREDVLLYNASTVITLLLRVSCLYAGLFVIIGLFASFLIDPGFLETTVGHPVGWVDYLRITWFSTSLALLGGALGSGFENEDAVREAAYSRRESERRAAPDELHGLDGPYGKGGPDGHR